jgi:hypothetical protein
MSVPNQNTPTANDTVSPRYPSPYAEQSSYGSHRGPTPLRVGYATTDGRRFEELQAWLIDHLPHVELTIFRVPGPQSSLARFQAIVVDLEGAENWLAVGRPTADCVGDAEVILVGVPRLTADHFRRGGIAIACELHGPWLVSRLGATIGQVLTFRLPLRLLCRTLVGQVAMKEALSLVRLTMLTEAIRRARSKSATARLLGVTRPAVQNMIRWLDCDPTELHQ